MMVPITPLRVVPIQRYRHIIAAGAVVTHGIKVPAHEIWAGIPAKKVKACAPGQAEEFAKHYSGYIKDWYLKED